MAVCLKLLQFSDPEEEAPVLSLQCRSMYILCGINGLFGYSSTAPVIDRDELRRMRDAMSARGPDGAGEWFSSTDRVAFGHRRLSIIDLSARGAQPMVSADGALVVTFNGEIYNYQALRRDLEAAGRVFQSDSDTEVLLHLYAERGVAMVDALRGMFAFALWDARRGGLLLARDPYGIKPLYYADDGRSLRFASQTQALRAGSVVSAEWDPAGEAGFYLFGSVPEPFTIYRDISALPAGCTLWADAHGLEQPRAYFSIADVLHRAVQEPRALTGAALQAQVREILLDSVRHHLLADVPVGVFLSAGVDSGALLGLMRDTGQADIQAVTLAFGEFRNRADDEAPLAQQVAALYGARQVTRVVEEAEFYADLPRILAAMDQPSIDGINTWFVSKAAREQGLKVAVSGLGGDELLGGYPSFRDIPRWVRVLGAPARIPGLGRLLRRLGHGLFTAAGRAHLSPKALSLLEYGGSYPGAYLLRRGLFMPWELPDLMGVERARDGLQRLRPLPYIGALLAPDPGTPFSRVATLEAALYMRNQLLRDADWAGMAHSLEIRVPLVDVEVLRQLAPLLVAERQLSGKMLLGGSPRLPLPEAILQRPKTGFRTPIQHWLERLPKLDVEQGIGHDAHGSRRWALRVGGAVADNRNCLLSGRSLT